MPELYKHQYDMVDRARASMVAGNRAILIQSATGSGKSWIGAELINRGLARGNRSALVVPRRDLIRQMDETFKTFGINHSFLADKYEFNPYSRVHVCSSGTLANRMNKISPKIVIIDETHFGAGQLDKIIKHYKSIGCFIIGLSATPWRLDGQGLGMWYDDMICGPSIKWLIQNKFLSDYRPFAPGKPDLSGVKTIAGDYAKNQLAHRMEADRVLIGDTVKHYREHGIGRLGITYTTSRKHSEITAQAYRDAGIPAMAMDSETPDDMRKKIIKAFARRELLQLVNCELLIFGFDLALQANMDVTVECMSDLQPTQSLSKQLQKWGRVLRKKDDPALIFDHAGNFMEHGLPDKDHLWTLQGEEKDGGGGGGRAIPVKQCEKCYFVHPPAPVCPNCGFVHPDNSRSVKEEAGELFEIDKETFEKMAEEARRKLEAKTLWQLVAAGKKMGKKNPEKWAAEKLTKRMAQIKRGEK